MCVYEMERERGREDEREDGARRLVGNNFYSLLHVKLRALVDEHELSTCQPR